MSKSFGQNTDNLIHVSRDKGRESNKKRTEITKSNYRAVFFNKRNINNNAAWDQ